MALARVVYVGGLATGTTGSDLSKCFPQSFHAVVIRTFGFITFTSAEEAAAATQTELQINGRLVHAALSHERYRPVTDTSSGSASRAGAGRSIFVRIPADMRLQTAAAVARRLGSILAGAHVSPPRVHVPRRQGGSDRHRGFAFVQCTSAADAAALLAYLQGSDWTVEMVRKKRSKAHGCAKHGKRRGGRSRRRGGGPSRDGQAASEDCYESDFESDDGDNGGSDGGSDGDDGVGREDGSGDNETVRDTPEAALAAEQDDSCVEAMAQFVSESREWALSVQGFLVDHCRAFDESEENRLEWTGLHSQLRGLVEDLLEAEVSCTMTARRRTYGQVQTITSVKAFAPGSRPHIVYEYDARHSLPAPRIPSPARRLHTTAYVLSDDTWADGSVIRLLRSASATARQAVRQCGRLHAAAASFATLASGHRAGGGRDGNGRLPIFQADDGPLKGRP